MPNIYSELYHEWFQNSNKWFSQEKDFDIYITDKYMSHILHCNDIIDSINDYDKISTMGAIIAYDQIPRHYNRIQNIDCQKYSLIARDISLHFIDKINNDEHLFDSITPHEWCFIFLPFRHVKDIHKVNSIINFMLCKHNNEIVSIKDRLIYKKFIYHCIRDVFKINTEKFLNLQKVSYNKQCFETNWERYSNILDHKPDGKIDNIKNIVVNEFEMETNTISKETLIIVSISGGVDSMISLHLLSLFHPISNIVAVHINYNNRKECKDEVNFVRQYCTLLGIKLYHRKIIEIKRDECRKNGLRELYEVATKNIRFDMYKQVAQLYDNPNFIVLLGHNKDDCFENIITNIGMKTNYTNLSGVEMLSEINDIVFWRPLLNIRKKDIIKYAKLCNIPYLQDSTPKWSQRGKIRDNVLPSLEDVNEDIVNSFFELKNRLSENERIVQTFVIDNIVKRFDYTDNVFTAEIPREMLLNDVNIWSSIFRTEQLNFKISHKCLKEFVKYIDKCLLKSDNKTKFVLKHNINAMANMTNDHMIKISFILVEND